MTGARHRRRPPDPGVYFVSVGRCRTCREQLYVSMLELLSRRGWAVLPQGVVVSFVSVGGPLASGVEAAAVYATGAK